jgi:hypothetical protein
MPLCTICKSIPFRRILVADKSLPVANIKDGGSLAYHVRSHDSISALFASGESCELCKTIAKSMKGSIWYQSMMTDDDQNAPVWLCLPVGIWLQVLWIYLGDDGAEKRVFGRDVIIHTALGELYSLGCVCRAN